MERYSYKERRCATCANYCSKREIKGDSVCIEDREAYCSQTKKKEAAVHYACVKFAKCGESVSIELEKKNKEIVRENERKAKKLQAETVKAMEESRREQANVRYREEESIHRERAALKKEKEEFEYQQWYAGLSKAEKKKEDLRVAEEQKIKQEEARKRDIERKREHEEYLEREKNRKITVKKAKGIEIVGGLLFVIGTILLIVGLCADNKKNPLGVIVPSLLGTLFMLIGLITFIVGYRKSRN